MLNFKPKNDFFFDQFDLAALNCHKAAIALSNLINDYTNIPEKVNIIEEFEHNGDTISHEIIKNLKKSFITPIDREDIYTITNKLDSVVDYIQAAAFKFDMLNIQIITQDTKMLCSKIVECTEKLPILINGLRSLKNTDKLKQTIIEINHIENDSDEIFRNAVRSLYRSNLGVLEKISIKEIYEVLEQVIDICEDVGDKVEEVVMKNA